MVVEAQIINGDCIDVLKTLPKESVDLILFSPPYDDVRDYDNHVRFNPIYLASELSNVLKRGGVCVMVMQDQTKNKMKSLSTFNAIVDFDKMGLNLWECLIYSRPGNPGAWWNTRFRVDHEYIPIFIKDGVGPKTFSKEHMKVPCKHAGKAWSGTQRHTDGSLSDRGATVAPTKCPGTILNYASSNTEGNKLKLQHPATFPDKLAEDLILAFTSPGDLVLDPMCGSGTTCVMAKKHGRNSIGIDVSEKYCEIARERLRD